LSRTTAAVAALCTLLAGTADAQLIEVLPRAGRAPDSEKLEAAADNLARMRAALKQVMGRADQARNEKDVVKLNCVNEKLTQIKALIKVAEQADVSLRQSLKANLAGEAAFSKIAIARTKVDGMRSQSEQCVGQLSYVVDEKTTVEVEQPGDLPGREVASLGVARRGENPADLVGDIGGEAVAGASGGFTTTPGVGGDMPFVPPPIVRPPAATPSN
jgi:hypothetical protein